MLYIEKQTKNSRSNSHKNIEGDANSTLRISEKASNNPPHNHQDYHQIQISTLKDALKESELTVKSLINRLGVQNEEILTYNKIKEDLLAQNDNAQKEISKLEDEVDNSQKIILDKEERIKKYTKSIKSSNEKTHELESNISSLNDQILTLNEEKKELEIKIFQDNKTHEDKINELQDINHGLNQKIVEKEGANDKLQNELYEQKQQYDRKLSGIEVEFNNIAKEFSKIDSCDQQDLIKSQIAKDKQDEALRILEEENRKLISDIEHYKEEQSDLRNLIEEKDQDLCDSNKEIQRLKKIIDPNIDFSSSLSSPDLQRDDGNEEEKDDKYQHSQEGGHKKSSAENQNLDDSYDAITCNYVKDNESEYQQEFMNQTVNLGETEALGGHKNARIPRKPRKPQNARRPKKVRRTRKFEKDC